MSNTKDEKSRRYYFHVIHRSSIRLVWQMILNETYMIPQNRKGLLKKLYDNVTIALKFSWLGTTVRPDRDQTYYGIANGSKTGTRNMTEPGPRTSFGLGPEL